MSESTEAPDDASVCVTDGSDSTVDDPHGVSTLPKTPLKVSAQAFAPPSVGEVAHIIQFLQMCLQSCLGVHDIAYQTDSDTLRVTATLHYTESDGELADHRKWVLETAQNVMLSAAQGSKCVYIIGWGNQPFEGSDSGFEATLCVIPPVRTCNVCWDAIQYGGCRRGSFCRWDHADAFEMKHLSFVLQSKTML